MTADDFDFEKTGGSKDSMEITADIKADRVEAAAKEFQRMTYENVISIINAFERSAGQLYRGEFFRGNIMALQALRREIQEVKDKIQ